MLFAKSKPLVSDAVQEQVAAAIRAAESRTTGEIRVFIESHCTYVTALDRAKEVFKTLAMEKTTRRNAVLIYLAIKDRQFALFGDEQIYAKAGGPSFWESAAQLLLKYLKTGQTGEGLCSCIDELGNALALHFPFDPAVEKNELPDEIVFGK